MTATATKHVLLIDDDLCMHDIVRVILEPAGYRVTCCTTAPAGKEVLDHDRPGLILLDIMLASPHEGIILAKDIKKDPKHGSIPVIMISSIGRALGTEYSREFDGSDLPGEGFLEKPLDPQELLETVDRFT